MKRAVFFLHYRSGSTLFLLLTGAEGGFVAKYHNKSYMRENISFLTTDPPYDVICKHVHCGAIQETSEGLNPNDHCITTRIGDWWGNCPINEIPDPYGSPTPMKWSYLELLDPFFEGYKFINLIRDGRNYIESMRSLKGGIEERLNNADPETYFIRLCKGYRNRAKIALDAQEVLGQDRYKIFYFRDLTKEPIDTIGKIYNFAYNLDVDVNAVTQRLEAIDAVKRKKRMADGKRPYNSSFKDAEILDRWRNWTTYERQIFEDIAGEVHKELGFEGTM
jgi:hypothetical protein